MIEAEPRPEAEAETNFAELKGNKELIDRVTMEMIGPDAPPEKLAEFKARGILDLDLPSARGVVSLSETGELKAYAWMHEIFEDESVAKVDKPRPELAPILEGKGRVFYIDIVETRRNLRGKRTGAGKEILEELLRMGVDEEHAATFILSTNTERNYGAHEMYLKFGFKDLTKIPHPDQKKEGGKNRVYMMLGIKGRE